MSQTVLEPEIIDGARGSARWMVVIYNNETNSMEEVVAVLVEATACEAEEAFIEMWEAHTYGKAPVHFASQTVCGRVAGVISSIGVRTEVCPEWE